MRLIAVLMSLLLGIFATALPLFAQVDLQSLSSGFWKGGVSADAQGNAWFCYLLGRKSNEEFTIQLYWSREGFRVLIYNSNWSLNTGEEFSGRVRIDNKFDEMVQASVFDSESIYYKFGFNNQAIEAFQSGNRITMEGPAGERTFRLTGTRKAVDVLEDCADEFFLVESGPANVPAPDHAQGLEAYDKEDYTLALRHWLPLAEQGSVSAQNSLGALYFNGQAVPKNLSTAVKWFRLSAEQGFAKAQNNLGTLYKDGKGVEKDIFEAVYWFRLAAEQGYAKAQNNLGIRYYNGEGVSKDHGEAIYWFRKAAEQGDEFAQNNMGEMFRDGEGVLQSNELAIQWFRLSAEQGFEGGQQNLDAMLALNTEPEVTEPEPAPEVTTDVLIDRATSVLEGDPTPEQEVSARKDVEAALAKGDRRALLLMSLILGNGIGGPTDLEKARDYLNQAADALVPEALYQRALLTAETDPDKALLDIRLAAAEGYVPALQVYATLDYWESGGSDAGTATPPLKIAKGELIGIQAMLSSLGYPAGPPLGEMTEETTAAIKAFQENETLPVNGVPTRELRDQLVKVLERGN